MGKYSPIGSMIRGTLETITGCALISFNDDGSWDYDGETDVWWDEQRTLTKDGEDLFVDEAGYSWKASELRDYDQTQCPWEYKDIRAACDCRKAAA